jgi:hypothetical protein
MVGMAMSGWLEQSWQAYRLILPRSVRRCEMRKPASICAWMKVDRLARIPFAAAHNAKIFSTDSNLDCLAAGTRPSCAQLTLTRWAPAMTHSELPP